MQNLSELNLTVDGRSYTLHPGQQARIGTASDAEIQITGANIAPIHAIIRFADGWQIDVHPHGRARVGTLPIRHARLTGAMLVQLGGTDSPMPTGTVDVRIREVQPAAMIPAMPPGAGYSVPMGALPPDPDLLVSGFDAARANAANRNRGGAAQVATSVRPMPKAPVTIGKAHDNVIVVDDFYASRYHARVSVGSQGLILEDLNSTNGTYCNGVAVTATPVRNGDRITIGNTDWQIVQNSIERDYGAAEQDGLIVDHVDFTISGGKRLIQDVSFTAKRNTLTAVIGPSGAGKSTLSRLLAGVTHPTAGSVRFASYDLKRNYAVVKSRIGLVPQEDVVPRQLKVRLALDFAAKLRLRVQGGKTGRDVRVNKAAHELGLEQHMSTRIDRLSGGQRKRVSVALELLTGPWLLILDEPTSGLDPALDRQVMRTLRDLADEDRAVLVITHSVAYLDLCDQVLILAPGGMTAYIGPPGGVEQHFGTSDWGDILQKLADDPQQSALD